MGQRNLVQRRVVIWGSVQGVAFRASTLDTVKRLVSSLSESPMHGWVKNRSDGAVEAVFQGPERMVRELVEWCKAGGPPSARVTKVDEESQEVDPELGEFMIDYEP